MNKTILIFLMMLPFTFAGFAQNRVLNVMPYPLEVTWEEGNFRIDQEFSIAIDGTFDDKLVENAANRFLSKLRSKTLIYFNQERIEVNQRLDKAKFSIQIEESSVPAIGVDESYELLVTSDRIQLKAKTTQGALWGLETLIQIVAADENGYYIPAVKIVDEPRFMWRGMLVDVARHFLPIDILKRNIDAMAAVKLNILHLHLTDDEGFRVESKLYPKLHQMGSNGRYYTQTELVDLVKYASDRGITIVPEFDLPGHSRSWFAGYPELASAPGPYKPGPRFVFDPNASREALGEAVKSAPTPTIDPTREEVYEFLDNLIGEMTNIFPSPYFHIGADENNGAAWRLNPDIAQFMEDNEMKNTHELHVYFVKRVNELFRKYNRTMLAYQEAYSEDLSKDIIFQAWIAKGDPMEAVSPFEIAGKGNSTLINTGFYLDLFFPSHVHYLNAEIPAEVNENIWGGEAALWSELVDENCFEGRAWPRTAAVAERLWSPATITDIDDMYDRLYNLNNELEELGLNHRLNAKRWIKVWANGTSIEAPYSVYECLAPFQGYRRLATTMMMPANYKYETVPLVNLPDLVEVDSEVEWQFRNQVKQYLENNNPDSKTQIENQLNKWKEASILLQKQITVAPNLMVLKTYADRIIRASVIGLLALDGNMDETEKEDALQQLQSMKLRTDVVEIRILDEIEALISGELEALSATYRMY
ncbi:beta-N-acetylhexosaminidase [uncultured Draconibacterium sp.]|uniref:beta-N-acetylhexosaminidase n=1 Tax=uncultured Draconibacterium sp. TaxID=1573823 RepID=UPI00321678B6